MSQAQEEIIIEQPVAPAPPAPVETPAKEELIEIEVTDAEQEAETDTQPEAKAFDPKTDRVEFSTPEQQAKYNDQYKQTKMADARNAMLLEMNQKAIQRIEELEGRFQQTDSAEAERILLGRVKAARDGGDDAAEIAALNELTNFKVEQRLAEKLKPANPVDQQQAYQHAKSQVDYVEKMQKEVDASGNLVRPYLHENYPGFDNVISDLESIVQRHVGDPLALEKSLFELDQVMRTKMTKPTPPPQPQLRAPNPLQGGNLTNTKQKTTIKMTRQELEIAKKLGVDPKRYAAERDKPGRR